MTVLYVLIPLALFLAAGAVVLFVIAVKGGQFEDLESPAWRILQDDDSVVDASTKSASTKTSSNEVSPSATTSSQQKNHHDD